MQADFILCSLLLVFCVSNLTLAMSGRESWAKRASIRDRSDYDIRGKHSDLGVASACQQMFVKRAACTARTSNVPCCSHVAQ